MAMAAASVLIVPFIRIGTQGHTEKDDATQIVTKEGTHPAETTGNDDFKE